MSMKLVLKEALQLGPFPSTLGILPKVQSWCSIIICFVDLLTSYHVQFLDCLGSCACARLLETLVKFLDCLKQQASNGRVPKGGKDTRGISFVMPPLPFTASE